MIFEKDEKKMSLLYHANPDTAAVFVKSTAPLFSSSRSRSSVSFVSPLLLYLQNRMNPFSIIDSKSGSVGSCWGYSVLSAAAAAE